MRIDLTNNVDVVNYSNGNGPLEIFAYDGDDIVTGSAGNDTIDGGNDNDHLYGGGGEDTLLGRDGNDYLQSSGGVANNYLDGGEGNDTLVPGSFHDTLIGGNGNDVYILSTNFLSFTFAASDPGLDRVEQGGDGFTLEGLDIEDLTLTGFSGFNFGSFGTGNDKANTIIGSEYANVLDGKGGNDLIRGLGGNDTLIGGFDVGGTPEYLYGGTGDDTYVVMDVLDTPVEGVGQGHDTVQSSIRWELGNQDIEDLVLTGTADINGFGNGLVNRMTGNSGANYLQGFAGYDTLVGGLGNDYYELSDLTFINDQTGYAYDAVIEAPNGGTDTVSVGYHGNSIYFLDANVENVIVADTANLQVVGNDLNNVMTGNAGYNLLYGQGGNDTLAGSIGLDRVVLDTLIGGTGDDTYVLSNRNYVGQFEDYAYDTVIEDANAGIDTVNVTPRIDQGGNFASNYTLPANVENGALLENGLLAFNLSGNALNNRLAGNAANNVLDGGAGLDTAIFSGVRAAYTVTRTAAGFTVTGPQGTDTLVRIEALKFSDTAVFYRPGNNDFNGDGKSDVMFSNHGTVFNSNYEWQINNRSLLAEHAVDLYDPSFGLQVVGDFDGDGKSDLLFQNPNTGGVWEWRLNGASILSQGAVDVADPSFHLLGAGDFDGSGTSDLLFRNNAGFVYMWKMNGRIDTPAPVGALDPSWHVQGAGDFDGDGKVDILLRNVSGNANENGAFFLWKMNGNAIIGQGGIERPPATWKTLGVGDFDGDGKTDFAVRNVSAGGDNGAVWIYLMNGTTIKAQGAAGIADAATWHVQQIGDLNGDLKDDILFRNDAGYFYSWDMDGTHIQSEGLLQGAAQWADPSFTVVTQHWDLV